MTDSPLVSVIMTVYNGEKYLLQAIESIRQQSLRHFEFIIIDDGSTDYTPAILTEAQKNDPRIKVISKSRVGRGQALNTAWKKARGIYIANLDADDVAQPDRLEKQMAYLQQHPDVGLLGTASKILNEEQESTYIKQDPTTDIALKKALVRYNPFVHSSVMMPRYVLEKVGGYNEKLTVLLDYDLWTRIATNYQIINLPDVLTLKRESKVAFFRNKISAWTKCKTHIKIRWYAWRNFSRSPTELRYVIFEPLAKFLYLRLGLNRFLSGSVIARRFQIR